MQPQVPRTDPQKTDPASFLSSIRFPRYDSGLLLPLHSSNSACPCHLFGSGPAFGRGSGLTFAVLVSCFTPPPPILSCLCGPFKRRQRPGWRSPRLGLTHPLVGFGAESVQGDLAREVCDAGDIGVVLFQGRQTHLLLSSTQQLHLGSQSRAPPAGTDCRTGKCHPGKVPPAQSALHFRLLARPGRGWYFS